MFQIPFSLLVFGLLSIIVMLFQACLAAGLPWGAASMGGKYPGKYPIRMRLVAILSFFLLGFLSAIVFAEANVYFIPLQSISGIGIWIVTVFFLIGTILNTITPSKIERIWAPVAFIQFLCCLTIALE